MNEREEYRKRLAIDQDAIDECLVEQPGHYTDVAEHYAKACAARDAAKLEVEEQTAKLDKLVRERAAADDERITETAITRQLTLDASLLKLQRAHLAARELADKWLALKEGYQQRSFMLRELVAIKLSEMNNLSLERGAHGAKRSLDDANERIVKEHYRSKRRSSG